MKMAEPKFKSPVLILITFLFQTQLIYCQLENVDNNRSTEKSNVPPPATLSSSTSPPPPVEPNTPNYTNLSLNSLLLELERNHFPTTDSFPFTYSTSTSPEEQDAVVPPIKKLPTILQEAATDSPSLLIQQRGRERSRNRNRDDRVRGRNNLRQRGGRNLLNRRRNRDRNNGNNPDKFLRRLVGLGSRFIARSLSFVTGDEVSESSEDKFRNFENPEYRQTTNDSSQEVEEGGENQSLNEKWRNLNPVQLLTNRFQIKANKMMRWRQVKDNYRKKELERRIAYFSDESGDFVTRNIRNLVRRLANRYEKETETMQLWVDYRKQRLQKFLEIPLVASILGKNNSTNEEITTTTTTPSTTTTLITDDFPASSRSLEGEQNIDESRRRDDQYDDDDEVEDARSASPVFNPIAEISRKFMRFIRNL